MTNGSRRRLLGADEARWIIVKIANRYGVAYDDIVNTARRTKVISTARSVAAKALCDAGATWLQIGEFLGVGSPSGVARLLSRRCGKRYSKVQDRC